MNLHIDAESLGALVIAIADRVVEQLGARANGNGRESYTEAEAATRLGLSRWALRDLRRAGRVQATKIGRRVVYTAAEVSRLAREGTE